MKDFELFLPEFSEVNGIYLDLARQYDAERIGYLSGDLIEIGLSHRVWNPQKVAEQICNPESLALVARDGRELVAFAIAEFGNKSTDLMLLGVSLKYRRLGIGSRLVKAMEGYAIALGHGLIHLLVRSTNISAQNFYRKLGFREIGIIHGYYSNRESALQMRHKLSFHPTVFPTPH
jgi:ribosomal-protein-alanine N-acetyltransferase